MVRRYVYLLWFSLITLSACGRDGNEGSTHSFRIHKEDGVTIIENRGGPMYPGELFQYEEVLRLIQDESNPESLLFHPDNWYQGSEGYFYVEDKGNSRIAVFDREGRFHHAIGRRGLGPGEFMVGQILSIEDDRLTVFDLNEQRTSIFTTDGTLLESISFFEPPFYLAAFHIGPREERIFISLAGGIWWGDPRIGPQTNRRAALILSATGDTLANIKTDPVTVGNRNQEFTAKRYFSGIPHILYRTPNSLIVCDGSEPVVDIYNLQGTLQRRILIQDDPIPVSIEDRREITSDLRKSVEAAENARNQKMSQWRLENTIIPQERDFCSKILVDEEGYIWLEIPYYPATGPISRSAIPIQHRMPTFRVLNAIGEYIGDTKTPTPSGQFSHGLFLTRRENPENGQIDLIAYRIVPANEGLKYP